MSERKMIHGMKTDFTAGESDTEIVITVETSPALMPPAWVNFLKHRLHVLHLDYKHVGAGRIVVMSTPHAAESVARLVLSAMESADHYFQTALRNMRAHGGQNQIAAEAAQRWAEVGKTAAEF